MKMSKEPTDLKGYRQRILDDLSKLTDMADATGDYRAMANELARLARIFQEHADALNLFADQSEGKP